MSPHILKRMSDRQFTEVDLRRMLHRASSHRPDIVEGRWIIATKHSGASWEVIVEPDALAQLLVVITAYSPEAE